MEKQIIVDTLKINYLEAGDSDLPPLLLLHGWGASAARWSGLIACFQRDFHVVAPDFPGFGKSEEPEDVWDSLSYCELTEAFLRAVKVKNPVVIAHSFGGGIGMMLAVRGFAAKLILVDSAGLPHRRRFGAKIEAAKKRFASSRFGQNRGSAPEEQETSVAPLMPAFYAAVAAEDLHSYLERIKIPTLLVWGSRDTETPLSDGEEMERILKGNGVDSALIVLTGFGHHACFEAEKRFYRICDAFLREGNEG